MYGYGYGLGGNLLGVGLSDKLPAVFVVMFGQSNTVGRALMSDIPVTYQGDITGVQIWNGTSFETLNASVDENNQFGDARGEFGAEMSFLKSLVNDYDTVYCMKYAVGATSLGVLADGGTASNWNPATVGSLYDTLILEVAQAYALLPATPDNTYVYYDQGEGDGTNLASSQKYYFNIDLLRDEFITDTGLTITKWIDILVRNNVAESVTRSPRVRMGKYLFAYENYPSVVMVKRDDLTYQADETHLTATGYVDVGIRAYNATKVDPSRYSICWTDDFSGVTIDSNNWLSIGVQISQNNSIIFNCPHNIGTVAFESGRSFLTRYSNQYGTSYIRSKITWTDPQSLQSRGGMLMHKDTNNYIAIMSDSGTNNNLFLIRRRVAGVNNDLSVNVNNGSEWKLSFNHITGAYVCSYWNGSSWVSARSELTSFTGDSKCMFTANDGNTLLGGDSYIFEEFDVTIADFTTRRPIV